MENRKKKHFSRLVSKACLPSDPSRKSIEVQINKAYSRRREHPPTPWDRQRSIKHSSKIHSNFDKHPVLRTSYDATCALDEISASGARLASHELANTTPSALVETNDVNYELNSVYTSGSRKHNLNHLLNFHYARRQNKSSFSAFSPQSGGGSNNASGVMYKNQKYNKEQFLQANFQFVIRACAKPKITGSPDSVVDWNIIEQINLRTTEEPQCPICLYPPIAAKLTRCGHAYCWPCILHYLALSDKAWRNCPICYEAVYARDLKSVIVVQQTKINVGNVITFNLMRREKGSLFIERYKSTTPTVARYPQVSTGDEAKFSKFLIATRANIFEIIQRERNELIAKIDTSCPETIFIQQALSCLIDREEKLNVMHIDEEEVYNKNAVCNQVKCTPEKIEFNVKMDEAKINYEFNYNGINDIAIDSKEIRLTEANQILETGVKVDSSSLCASEDNTRKYYYFYQCNDGQNIFLHPLNVKMLQSCYNSLYRSPLVIKATILQTEHHSMDDSRRRKFTCLGHLPLTCQFSVVEVDLQPPLVSENVLELFKDDLLFRKKERQRRDREENKREKHIAIINDRKMGKLISSAANLNLDSTHDFPTCGFEQSLILHDKDMLGVLTTPTQTASYSSVTVCGKSTKPTTCTGVSGGKARPESQNGFNESMAPMSTKLGDVLAEAILKKKKNSADCSTDPIQKSSRNPKKSKSKKIQPLFSTGINYNGNK